MRTLLISLVQSINGSFAEDDWSTGVSNDTDFAYFLELRRRAGAIIIDRRTALNPQLPVINAPGKKLEHTPVHVLTSSDARSLGAELAHKGLNYQAHHFTPQTVASVLNRVDSSNGVLLCESGPNLAFRLLDSYPGAELHLSISPLYSRSPGSHFSALNARIDLALMGVETNGNQIIARYLKA